MRINLLPPEIYERQRVRRRTAAVIVVGLIVLAALGAFYFLQMLRLNEVEDDIAAQEAENAQLRAQIGELQEIDALQQEIEATRTVLNALLADRVLWSGVLRDVSLVIPGQAWLSGLNGQVGAPGTAGTTATTTTGTTTTTTTPGQAAQPGALVGQISFDGFAFTHRDVALWLSRLEDVRGFVNPWLSNSTKTDIGTQQAVQFNSSVDLSEQALARRRGGQGGGGQ
ncbi:MAG: PilN domain-containing protein [Actinomycetota bacterium]